MATEILSHQSLSGSTTPIANSIDRPSIDRPSIDRPSIDRPSIDRPSIDRPEHCEATHPGPTPSTHHANRHDRNVNHLPSSIEHAEQDLLDQLNSLGTVHALVRCTIQGGSPRLERTIRISTSPKDARSQSDKLLGICTQAAKSGQTRYHRQLSPRQCIIGVPANVDQSGQQLFFGVIIGTEPNSSIDIEGVESMIAGHSLALLQVECDQSRIQAEYAAAALDLSTRSLHCQSRSEIAQCIASHLASHLGLQRVGLGYRSKKRSHCRLLALSDSARIASAAVQTRLVETAMDEAILFGDSIHCSSSESKTPAEKATYELACQTGESVVIVPLVDEDYDGSAALACVLSPQTDLTNTLNFLSAATPILTALVLARQTHPLGRLVDRARQFIKARPAVLSVVAIAALTLAMLVPVTHRETCTVTIEPGIKRYVAAPFDAALSECLVTPGDLVERGDVLAVLDGRELRWEREGLQADHHQAVKKRDAAQASRAYADQRIAQLDIDRIESELKLLDHRLGELEIRSPVSGVIVSGNLERAQGAPVQTGQTLFEVAPLKDMIAESSVPDQVIGYMETGLFGTVRLNAYPGESWETTIKSIHPRSEIREEQNVFIADCPLSNSDNRLRPGMMGQIKIDCGEKRLYWILSHRSIDALRRWTGW